MRFHGKLLFLVVSAVLLVAAVAGAEDVPMADNAYIGNEACLDCQSSWLSTLYCRILANTGRKINCADCSWSCLAETHSAMAISHPLSS